MGGGNFKGADIGRPTRVGDRAPRHPVFSIARTERSLASRASHRLGRGVELDRQLPLSQFATVSRDGDGALDVEEMAATTAPAVRSLRVVRESTKQRGNIERDQQDH